MYQECSESVLSDIKFSNKHELIYLEALMLMGNFRVPASQELNEAEVFRDTIPDPNAY